MSLSGKVTDRSWMNPGVVEDGDYRFSGWPIKRVALTLFLAVATSMFFLFLVSYVERMELGDWRPVAEPAILWVNTICLLYTSDAADE